MYTCTHFRPFANFPSQKFSFGKSFHHSTRAHLKLLEVPVGKNFFQINDLSLKRMTHWKEAELLKGCIVAYRTNNFFFSETDHFNLETYGLNGFKFGYISKTAFVWGDSCLAYNLQRFLFKHEIEDVHPLSDIKLQGCSLPFYDSLHWSSFYDGLNLRLAAKEEIRCLKESFENNQIKLELENVNLTTHILEGTLKVSV